MATENNYAIVSVGTVTHGSVPWYAIGRLRPTPIINTVAEGLTKPDAIRRIANLRRFREDHCTTSATYFYVRQ